MNVTTEHTCLHRITIDVEPIVAGPKTIERQLYVCPFYPFAGRRRNERFEIRMLTVYDRKHKIESALYGCATLDDAIASAELTAQSLHGEPEET